jgi:hypothetical protein
MSAGKATEAVELDRVRARLAYDLLVDQKRFTVDSEVATRVKSLPVQVRTQGITVALATLMRGSGSSTKLAELIATWLLDRSCPAELADRDAPGKPTPERALGALIKAKRITYILAQQEALALVEQAKLIADALGG